MAYSIIKDLDLDKRSKHETEALGDFGLFDLMRVIILSCNFTLSCIVTLLGFCKDTSTSSLVCR